MVEQRHLERVVTGETEMQALGAALAEAQAGAALTVGLQGGLGAGKTTLVRGWLRALGVTGRIRSPSYTLIEPYETPNQSVFHVDLYRIADPAELETLDLGSVVAGNALLLVEWPQHGGARLPARDLTVSIDLDGCDARSVTLSADSAAGLRVLQRLEYEQISS